MPFRISQKRFICILEQCTSQYAHYPVTTFNMTLCCFAATMILISTLQMKKKQPLTSAPAITVLRILSFIFSRFSRPMPKTIHCMIVKRHQVAHKGSCSKCPIQQYDTLEMHIFDLTDCTETSIGLFKKILCRYLSFLLHLL